MTFNILIIFNYTKNKKWKIDDINMKKYNQSEEVDQS